MTITPSTLTRGGAIGAAVAGVLFILIQPLHPPENLASLATSTWAIVHGMSLTMAIFGLAGITAAYLRQVSKFGILGLVAYLLFALFFIMQAVFVFAEIFIAPLTAAGSPDFTEDFIALFANSEAPTTDLGLLVAAVPIGGAAYLLGGTLFGVAIIRAGILARWSGILLIVGSVASLAAAVVPHEQARLAAIPMGLALAGLGYAMWSEQRATGSGSDTRRRQATTMPID